MKKMKIAFFGVAIYMILLTASSQGLTARIKPNRTTFFFETGSKPTDNITCESDCGRYQWRCTYSWVNKKNGRLYNYIAGNNSRIDTPQKENVTLHCVVRYGNIYDYSEAINIFVEERMPPSITTTPILDGNNAGNAETNITKENGYAPRNITIESTKDINDLKEGPGDIEIICNADCKPKCDRYRIYHIGTTLTTFEQARISITKHRRNSGRYYCAAFNSLDNGFLNSTNSLDIDIKYGPRSASVMKNGGNINMDIIEKEDSSMTITLQCSSSCNPPCAITWYKDGQLNLGGNPAIDITKDRSTSGVYQCEASGVEGKVKSDEVHVTIQYKPTITSSANQTTITAPTLMNLAFSVDSFPSSNVTIFHETNRLTFIPNVTGHLSFNVSVESCLDQGDYRIEAVNDAGLDRLTVRADVECPPIAVRYSDVSQKEFRVGDVLRLRVVFMANPTADVSWSFVPWNKNTSTEVQRHQIQNHNESTKIILILSDTDKFGKYRLELKNNFGTMSKEFNIQGPTQTASKAEVRTTSSLPKKPDSEGGLSLSTTSRKGKASAISEVEMNTFLLQQDMLQEEVHKLRIESDVLRLKKNYYIVKLQLLLREHPGVIDEIFGED